LGLVISLAKYTPDSVIRAHHHHRHHRRNHCEHQGQVLNCTFAIAPASRSNRSSSTKYTSDVKVERVDILMKIRLVNQIMIIIESFHAKTANDS
jgi:hypothetical protein